MLIICSVLSCVSKAEDVPVVESHHHHHHLISKMMIFSSRGAPRCDLRLCQKGAEDFEEKNKRELTRIPSPFSLYEILWLPSPSQNRSHFSSASTYGSILSLLSFALAFVG